MAFMLFSCNNNDDSNGQVLESDAARIYLNAVKESNGNLNSQSTIPEDLCFSPVFPIELNYSDGDRLTVNSMQGLKEAIYSENSSHYILSISYPFGVVNSTSDEELIVSDENQFLDLLSACEYIRTVDNLFASANCFDFVYPLSVIDKDGDLITIPSQSSLEALLGSMNENDYWVDFVYPFQITYGDSNVTINNNWDFYNYLDCTPDESCICTTDINPVCVQTTEGIVQFENLCWAQCAGYTEQDLVSCD